MSEWAIHMTDCSEGKFKVIALGDAVHMPARPWKPLIREVTSAF
jgi:hypothetical protein